MTWEEAKDQIAKEDGAASFELIKSLGLEPILNKAMELYAREVADKAWEASWEYCIQRIARLETGKPVTAPSKEEFMKQFDKI